MSFFSSSWCRRLAAVCGCGTPWTFLLTFLPYYFSTNETAHNSSHLMQQTSSFNTETHSESKDESILNLNLSNKGINIGFLNVQGICSSDRTKFSESELFSAAETNSNIHILNRIPNATVKLL